MLFSCLFRDWVSSHRLCSCCHPSRLKKQQHSSWQTHESQGFRFWSLKTCCGWSLPCVKHSSWDGRIFGSRVRPSLFSMNSCVYTLILRVPILLLTTKLIIVTLNRYYISQQLTDKSDIYSFGVILLELISGQEAISNESFGVNCRNIVQWVSLVTRKSSKFFSPPMNEMICI